MRDLILTANLMRSMGDARPVDAIVTDLEGQLTSPPLAPGTVIGVATRKVTVTDPDGSSDEFEVTENIVSGGGDPVETGRRLLKHHDAPPPPEPEPAP